MRYAILSQQDIRRARDLAAVTCLVIICAVLSACDTTRPSVTADIANLRALEATFFEYDNQGRIVTISSTGAFNDRDLEQLRSTPDLTALYLLDCRVTDSGLKHIVDNHNLKHLALNSAPVSDRGVKLLSRMSQLLYLDLEYTRITDACVPDLLKLTNLKTLSIENSHLSELAKSRLRKGLPKTAIW